MNAGTWLILLGILGWMSSWWWHPLRRCPKCKGESRNYGGVFRKNWYHCARCGGNGRQPRIGHTVMRSLGVFKHPADETGPGWNARRRRERRR